MTVASTGKAAGRANLAQKQAVAWHTLTPEQACERFGVEVSLGLDAAEIGRRRAQVGPNKLAEAKKEPGWRAFLHQYRDLMQLVLLGAAIVSIVALQDSTGFVIFGVTLLNAILGLYQEGKATESVAALQKMLVIKAHARRGGDMVDIPAEELVPGDIVSFEAGDKIPADGRLLVAATLEIEEAALTGESTPVYTIANGRFVQLMLAALVLTFLVTSLGPLQRIFDTVALSTRQWGICLLTPLAYIAVIELIKLASRILDRRRVDAAPVAA